jgi:hypothetical protein
VIVHSKHDDEDDHNHHYDGSPYHPNNTLSSARLVLFSFHNLNVSQLDVFNHHVCVFDDFNQILSLFYELYFSFILDLSQVAHHAFNHI